MRIEIRLYDTMDRGKYGDVSSQAIAARTLLKLARLVCWYHTAYRPDFPTDETISVDLSREAERSNLPCYRKKFGLGGEEKMARLISLSVRFPMCLLAEFERLERF